MSGKVVGWAFGQTRLLGLSPTQRFVLVAYADNANERDGKCWPDKEEIVEKTGYSLATVYRAIKELEKLDLVFFTEDEKGRPCAYLRVDWFSHGEKTDSQSENENSHSEKGTNKGTVTEPSQEEKPKKGGTEKAVDRRRVTEPELDLAAAVVSQFNSSAGTALSVDAHLTPIVMRIREKPGYEERHHRAIIEAVFAGEHWWKGPPTPKVIYGNAAIFEQSIELARAAQSEKKKLSPLEAMNADKARIRREQGLE